MKPVVSCKNGTQSFFFALNWIKSLKEQQKAHQKAQKIKKFNPNIKGDSTTVEIYKVVAIPRAAKGIVPSSI